MKELQQAELLEVHGGFSFNPLEWFGQGIEAFAKGADAYMNTLKNAYNYGRDFGKDLKNIFN